MIWIDCLLTIVFASCYFGCFCVLGVLVARGEFAEMPFALAAIALSRHGSLAMKQRLDYWATKR